MSIFSTVIKGLSIPDSQGNDWYGWATNQCAHAFFGVCLGLLFPTMPFTATVIMALLKETSDIIKSPSRATAKDSLTDAVFWLLGAWIASAGSYTTAAVIIMAFGLICGIIPRVRKAINENPGA